VVVDGKRSDSDGLIKDKPLLALTFETTDYAADVVIQQDPLGLQIIQGQLAEAGKDKLKLTGAVVAEVSVDAGTLYRIGDKTLTASDLKPGQRVILAVSPRPQGPPKAMLVCQMPAEQLGLRTQTGLLWGNPVPANESVMLKLIGRLPEEVTFKFPDTVKIHSYLNTGKDEALSLEEFQKLNEQTPVPLVLYYTEDKKAQIQTVTTAYVTQDRGF
jgi:hypothetical protein